MKFGSIKCECGKEFYFETVASEVNCPYCDHNYSTDGFDEKIEIVEEVIDEEKFEFAEEVEA